MAKKLWEMLQEDIEKNKQASENLRIQANQQFNEYTSKNGTYDTTKHYTTIGDLKKAYKNNSNYNTFKKSLNNYYRNSESSLWNKIKTIATTSANGNNNFNNQSNVVRDNFGKINTQKTVEKQADQTLENLNRLGQIQSNTKNYQKTQEESLRSSLAYKQAKLQNPKASDKEIMEIAKKNSDLLHTNLIKDIASKNGTERTTELKNISISNSNPLFYDNNKFRELNNNVLQYKTSTEAQKEANKINKDLENGKIGSSVGHILGALPQKAMEAVASPIYSMGSLLNLKLPTGTADQDLQDWKAISSKYDKTTANINNDTVKTASNISGTIGYMIPSILASAIAPETNLGRITQGVSVGGQGYIENLNDDGSNKFQSALTGLGKGYASYAIEGITGGNILGKGSLDDLAVKTIASKTSNKASKKIASMIYEVGGEVFEEEVENQANYLIDKIVNDKGISLKDWLNEQEETVKNTVLSTIVLKMLGLGGNTYNDVQQYSQNAEIKKWINEAEKIIQKENLTIDVDKLNAKNNQAEVKNILNTLEKENNTSNLQQQSIQTQQILPTQQISQEQNNMVKNEISEQITREERLEKLRKIDTSEIGLLEKSKIKKEIRALEQGFNSIEEYDLAEEKRVQKVKEEQQTEKLRLEIQKKQLEEQKRLQLQKDISESTSTQNAQFRIIQKTNPMLDDYHTGIRSPKEIKTFDETINDEESFEWGDFSREDAKKALEEGKVTIYSSYPIENGVFISTSKVQAEEYAGGPGNKVYSKKVPLQEVAWINGDEGQYAKVNNIANNLETLYNNIGLEKIKNIPIQDILPLRNGGGIRNTQQINNLKKDIKENGIKNPIELVRNNDGSIEIENGNHRLLIAEELGLKEVPIKFVESWDNIGIKENISETKFLNRMEVYNDRNNRNSRETNIFNGRNRINEGNSIDNRNELENRGATEKNDRLSRGIQGYNDRPSSNTTLQENTIEQSKINNILPTQETSNEASINLPTKEINLPTKQKVKNMPVKQQISTEKSASTKQNRTLNPTEISNISLENANTTPTLPTRNYKKGNKESSFFSNVVTDAKFLNKDLRQEMAHDENIRYYKGITNAETLENAYTSLQDGGQQETLQWFNKETKNVSAEDVAKGWILLKQYQDSGDYQGAVEVAKKMRDMATGAGQTIQAYNILSRLTPEGMFYYAQSELNEAYNKMVQGKSEKWIEENRDKFDLTPEETQFIMGNMNEVASMEDGYDKKVKIAEIQKIVSDKIPPTLGQSVKTWMRISMLFNPKTQVRNVSGNAVILPVNATSDFVASGIDKLISKKTGVRTTGNVNLKNYTKGFGKGLYESYNDFRKGINTRNIEGNRFEVSEGKNFKNKGIGKALNRVDSLLSFMLDAGDRGFYEATFTNSINNQLVLNNTTEVTQEMIDIATNEALQRTWQDNNKYTEAVFKIRNILNYANIKGYGLGDVIIPFAKTPANLTKAIVDYSPVGLVKAMTLDARTFKNSLENGQFTPQMQHKFVQNLGKGMAGSFLYVLGYALAKAGIASGEADDDKDVKNFMKNSLGISSYSIKIGDKTFTYDWAQPVATPLAIMTNYVKYSEDNPDANIIEKGIKSLNIGTEQLLQQSFMESLNTVLNGNGTTLENLSQSILELPARAIPTFSKQIADMVDGTQRTSFEYDKPLKSAVNSVVAKIPFASKTLPVSRDTLGNEIKKYGGENNIWNVMFNPANVNKGELSKAGEEIFRLYQETGETTIFPITAPYYINSKGEKITMTAEQRSEYQKVTGEYTEKAIEELILNSSYKKLSNEKKAELITDIISDSNAKAKHDILDVETEEAKKKRELIEKVSTKNYYDYRLKTKDIEGEDVTRRKNEVLLDANYSDKVKSVLYTNTTGKEDSLYNILSNGNIDINEYLEYKIKDSKDEFSADKDKNGNSISGSSKKKVYNYVNNNITGVGNRLIILGSQYKLQNSERQALTDYINKTVTNNSDRLEIFKKLSKNYTVKDGKVYYK